MNALRLAVMEFRRQKRPLQVVAVIFLMLLPLLYGALYLWSAWDPYGDLDRLPVALVDQDLPVAVDGRQIAAGREFVDQLEIALARVPAAHGGEHTGRPRLHGHVEVPAEPR